MKKLIKATIIAFALFALVSCASSAVSQETYMYSTKSASATQESFVSMMKEMALLDGATEEIAEMSVKVWRDLSSEEFIKMMGFDSYIGATISFKSSKVLSISGEQFPYAKSGNEFTGDFGKIVLSEDGKALTLLMGDDEFQIAMPFYVI